MKVKDFLTENTWIKGHFATNRAGGITWPRDSEATGWCLAGAIDRCYPLTKDYDNATQKLNTVLGHYAVAEFNDRSTWLEVKAVIDEADI